MLSETLAYLSCFEIDGDSSGARKLHGFVARSCGCMRVGRAYFLQSLISRLGENVQSSIKVALIKVGGGID